MMLVTDCLKNGIAENTPTTGFLPAYQLMIAVSILALFAVLALFIRGKIQKRKRGAVIGVTGEYKGARFPIGEGEEIILGTDAGHSNIVLPVSGILSRKHCGISYDRKKDVYRVTDYSASGTFTKNGRRMETGRQNLLRGGTRICLGGRGNMFKLQ